LSKHEKFFVSSKEGIWEEWIHRAVGHLASLQRIDALVVDNLEEGVGASAASACG